MLFARTRFNVASRLLRRRLPRLQKGWLSIIGKAKVTGDSHTNLEIASGPCPASASARLTLAAAKAFLNGKGYSWHEEREEFIGANRFTESGWPAFRPFYRFSIKVAV